MNLDDIKRDCRMRDQRDAVDALNSLSDAGLIEKYERTTGPKGGRPAIAYRIVVSE